MLFSAGSRSTAPPGSEDELAAALARNVWRGAAVDDQARLLAAYVVSARMALAASDVAGGVPDFGPLPDGSALGVSAPISIFLQSRPAGAGGDDIAFAAGEDERAALAKFADLLGVSKFEARIVLKKLSPNRFCLVLRTGGGGDPGLRRHPGTAGGAH